MKLNLFFISVVVGYMFWGTLSAMACTGITLKSQNGTAVVARTIEWGGSNLNSQYRTSGPSRLFYPQEKNNFYDPSRGLQMHLSGQFRERKQSMEAT